jgi:anti-sigma factor RsiW
MKQRDLELLSSYLDGQLSPSDATRLEARLLVEPDLRSVLRDLRSARNMLRQLPMRKAPRNFRLTPKMVGKNPPLPRAYPAFRFTSALATIMLFITMGLNFIRPQLATAQPAFGMGGGGAPDTFSAESAPAAEMPAATEAPEEPSVAMAPQATMTIDGQEDTARVLETPTNKEGETENALGGGLDQPPAQGPASGVDMAPVVPPVWQWLLAGVALVSAFIMAMMRQLSISRWRKKN